MSEENGTDWAGLTVKQVAMRLGKNRETVYRWIRAGDLPAVRIGGQLSIRLEDLREFVGIGGKE